MTYEMMEATRHIMVEDGNGTRYEYYSSPIYKSNIDHTIAYYEPTIKTCMLCESGTGSTVSWRRTSVEEGNEHFKQMLAKGFKVVMKRSFA